MKFRLYPSKDTTIIEGTDANTGLNPVGEIWYGKQGVARHLIYFNEEPWEDLVSSGYAPSGLSGVTCTLKMFNCYPIFEGLIIENERQARSVDVEVLDVTTTWDEGNEFSFERLKREDGFANWYSATSLIDWDIPGGDYGMVELFSMHLDKGNENIEGDVTDAVTDWVVNDLNQGLMLKFTDDYEDMEDELKTILKFHNRETNTYFLPYVEFEWDGQVKDERAEVGHGLVKRLYFYSKKSNTYTNVNTISGVTVEMINSTGGTVDTIEVTGSSIENQCPGIYFVEYSCPVNPDGGSYTFTDTWNVQFESGGSYYSIEQSGSCESIVSEWDTSQSGILEKTLYNLSIPDLKNEYSTGSTLYLPVRIIEAYTNNTHIMRGLQYKISMVDGTGEFVMVDWENLSYTNEENLLILNTSWFIPNNLYKITFRSENVDDRILEQDLQRYFWVR